MRYLKDRITAIVYILICTIIAGVIFYLRGVEPAIVIYVFVLWIAVGTVFVILDFISKRKRIKVLKNIAMTPFFKDNMLPKEGNSVEKEYQTLVNNTIAEAREKFSESDSRITEANEFYTMWVHQIKTPISAMKVLIDSGAERDMLSAELFKIEKYADMALSFIRVGSETSDYVIKQCNLEKVVKDTVKTYAPLFIQKNLSVSMKNLDVYVLTDEKWLGFALEQVISNAVKYSRNGSVEIYSENGILTVEDHGTGIAREDMPRIFERGFTGANGRSGRWSTGIGLYLCKRVLTELGHYIWIESKENVGTKVHIDLNSTELKVE